MGEACSESLDDVYKINDSEGYLLACIIRSTYNPPSTIFISESASNPQYGIIAYPRGHVIPRHHHRPLPRTIEGTPETLFIRKGKVKADIYDKKLVLVASFSLNIGDIIVLHAGGHGFTMEEDSSMFEVKQGPYAGSTANDKVQF